MAEEPGPGSWWKTLPGVVTAIAGMITAITGLILALNQVLPRSNPNPASPTASSQTAETTVSPSSARRSGAAPYRVKFLAGTHASLGELSYDVVGARVENHNPGELALKLSIRLTNNRGYSANFWDSSFRLLGNGAQRAPISGLNEVVEARSTADGTVAFVVPSSVHRHTLLVGEQEGQIVRLPLVLTPVRAG